MSIIDLHSKNVRLWLWLAAIPVAIVLMGILFGTCFLNGDVYTEEDLATSGKVKVKGGIKEETSDITSHQTKRKVNTTAKAFTKQMKVEKADLKTAEKVTPKTNAVKVVATSPKTSKTITPKSDTSQKSQRLLDEKGKTMTITLQPGQSLQDLSHDKFGNRAFWVYFYAVNRDKLSNPNNLVSGMKLYVPNPKYFGFSASDKNSIKKAKHEAAVIFANIK